MRLKTWQKLSYLDPKGLLVALRDLSMTHALSELPYNVASLRTNNLNKYREGRQCALFCYGMSQRLGVEIRFAMHEDGDIDSVGTYELAEERHFVPIQLKEHVPEIVRPEAALQAEIDKLRKYVDSSDLTVAFHLNRTGQVRLSELDFSRVPVKELWFFGATDESQDNWLLIGNLLSQNATFFNFSYPQI